MDDPDRRRGVPRLIRGWRRPRWELLILLVALAVGGGLRAERAAHPGRFMAADERAYARLADDLTRGHFGDSGMRHPFHWGPGTPVAFAAAQETLAPFGMRDTPSGPSPAYWMQVLIGLAMIAAAYALARELAGRAAAAVAATATALYPPLIAATGELVSEPLGALTLTVAVWLAVRAWRRASMRGWVLAAAVLGVAILARADLLPLPLVIAAPVLMAWPAAPQRRAAGAAVFAAVCLATIAPWVLHASAAAGQFIPVTDAGSSTLFVASYLPGGGTMFGLKRTPLADRARASHSEARRLTDSQLRAEWILDKVARPERGESRDHELRQDAMGNLRRYALGDPVDFAAMTFGKVGRMWLSYDRGTTHAQRLWILLLHLLVVSAALGGLLWGLLKSHDSRLGLVLLTLAAATAISAFFVAEPRQNLRLLPTLIAGGAAGAVTARRLRIPDRPER